MSQHPSPTPTCLLKFGGSLITEKTGLSSARTEVIDRLAKELRNAQRTGERRIILGHGSGSFGHPAAEASGVLDGVEGGDSLAGVTRTQSAARELHRIVVQALEANGLFPFSLPPSAWMVADGGHLQVLTLQPIQAALKLGLLPVVCGDIVFDHQRGVSIASTEAVLLALARALQKVEGYQIVDALWLGNTAGVLDGSGRLIEELTDDTWDPNVIRESSTTDVTGGIRLRVETAQALARLGVPSLITDGRQPGVLEEVLSGAGRPGTQVPACGLHPNPADGTG